VPRFDLVQLEPLTALRDSPARSASRACDLRRMAPGHRKMPSHPRKDTGHEPVPLARLL
jgi:hypothetical protein